MKIHDTDAASLASTNGSHPRPEIAIAHDFLVERGGAERVLVQLAKCFPEASIHTALCRPDATYGDVTSLVATSLLTDRLRLFGLQHRASLPFAAKAFRQVEIDADVLIASSSGLAHLAGATGRRIVYCHTPARWLHKPDEYFRRIPPAARRLLSPAFRRWLDDADRAAMRSADLVVVNSEYTAGEVRRLYDVDPYVVRPVSSLRTEGDQTPLAGVEPGFFLTPSRLLGYKRLDVLLEAATALPHHRFVVVGQGPLLHHLRRHAPTNVRVAGGVPEAVLRWAFRNCHAVVLTSADDYGLVPDEAAAFGKLAVTPLAGGYLEQHSPGTSTTNYRFADPMSLRKVIDEVAASDPVLPIHDLDVERHRFEDQINMLIASLDRGSDR